MANESHKSDDPEVDIQQVICKLVLALKRLEGYNPVLDLPLIEEVARSAAFIRLGESFLINPKCSPGTYASISDGIAKHASRMRQAMKELAATRAERMRYQTATAQAAQVKEIVDKIIHQENEHDSA
ncbi:MAG: hypothetical protein ABSF82_11495 [Candidatus Bathyarchaeia archaeon]|jgi:hypothetical protein